MVSISGRLIFMFGRRNNPIVTLLLAFLLFIVAGGTSDAEFYFRGYTYNETNVTLNNTIVSIEIYQMGGQNGPTLMGTVYNSSDASGFFNVTIPNGQLDSNQNFYKPVLKHYVNNASTGTLDWIGQSLPQFPRNMIAYLTLNSPMNFYMRKGGTIYLTASGVNQTGIVAPVAFRYMIKDTRLGYPITENFTVEQLNVGPLHVPSERNYSIMIFPNQSLPVSYDLNNLTDYTNSNATITFNTTIRPRWVYGYALNNNAAGFENLNVIAYLMEPGDIIGKSRPMPSNMSAFRGNGASDTSNASTGYYNITLPGSAQGTGANILLFATAYNKSGDRQYYGAFNNITMNYSASDVPNFNFTLHPLLGNVENISVNNMGLMGQPQNIATKMLPFQLINGSSGANITNSFAHIEMEVNYSSNGSSAFKWMVDVSQTENGSFSIPAISAPIRKINVFMQDFAPLKTSKNTTQLAIQPVNIALSSFDNKKPDGNELSGIFLDLLLSKPECDVPNPASGCSLMPDPTTGQSEGEFNPFKVVLGGGKISMRIKQTSTRITVHYKNVDMLASGPPDALFDESATSSQSGSALDQAWKFGSKGPEIYDEVLIGVPVTSGMSITGVKLGKLYDENWNAIWNITDANATENIPSDYSGFNASWFNTTGPSCSTTDTSSACYIDSTNGTLWLRIPHFSGVGPTISGTTTTTSGSSSSGGGGGGGGGGGASGENYSNIVLKEKYDEMIYKDIVTSYTFKNASNPVMFVNITGNVNAGLIETMAEVLRSKSTLVKEAPPGIVYKNVNLWVGTSGFATSKNIKEATVAFKVDNAWLASNGLEGNDVKLIMWDGSKWNLLETTEKSKDGTFTFFEGKTTGFSSFAITGMKTETIATPAIGINPASPGGTATPASVPIKKGIPGFEATVFVLVISMLAVSLINDRKRR